MAELAGELVLPLADQRRPDGLQGSLPEPGSDVASQPVFRCSQGGWAAIGVGRPHRPPLICPPVEGQSAPPPTQPGAPSDLQLLLSLQFPCLGRRSNGPGTLRAVIQE